MHEGVRACVCAASIHALRRTHVRMHDARTHARMQAVMQNTDNVRFDVAESQDCASAIDSGASASRMKLEDFRCFLQACVRACAQTGTCACMHAQIGGPFRLKHLAWRVGARS